MKTEREMKEGLEREAKTWGLAYKLATTQEEKSKYCDLIHSIWRLSVDIGGIAYGDKVVQIARKEAGLE